MSLSIADDVLATARVVRELVADDAVARRWRDESACAGMTVGGLTHHLAAQATTAIGLLSSEPYAGEPIPVAQHYRQAPWANSSLDAEVNVSIREGSDEAAGRGHAAVLAQLDEEIPRLADVLDGVDDDTAVLVPWQGWALTAHDLVVTRLMEMVVHGDDLAASVDLPTPAFPREAVRLVVGLLGEVAVDRHGQVAVVRALSRPQRAPATVSAF
ncbi:maleylpyruvate isomerase N-terminal domain-containing protein [Nocardioides coralli]|uniref:maleylpyruvate isomerase N-terminal domain-containing protein n=1 Tax=Nocardioides coralli TaxID=2872154 RepID=UPI001CA3F6CD|nr:maleylpyruvate isomerase N-terminal domain-containing protein [Nocardioides coralli]QZY28870.1 maleylpyruvate isomerase N-terminal domain-containing protein [Nocardioides coralli]